MVYWKTVSDICLVTLTFAVLANYLIQRTEYFESYIDYKMSKCLTNDAKIEQLEKWDANNKYEAAPLRSQASWNLYWFMYRERTYQKFQHIFHCDYVPPHLRYKKIVLTEGGKYLTFS
ncbi:uncharacterized protein CELE_M02E1.4 [Caenorhabditis elegans]|uniref:Uncharacterized protein n=1 Tax=Caenorhabditis elegans TaxID=6239 RepID=A0A2K5AU18_CAEEL|nr:Uncharacterized protein CELE_M02E1.4 [Caenorhabditis elegans]SPC48675.1 Uncharacterized protein CELE_M02E1.4 [Caenorhabditis elegans]|eukprot:NP_001348814.1 Uncharacterized protein CELE_M02E1.4 [Caenorhabditis elegans]